MDGWYRRDSCIVCGMRASDDEAEAEADGSVGAVSVDLAEDGRDQKRPYLIETAGGGFVRFRYRSCVAM